MIYAIISEFNPFHKGHKYLIDSVKEENDGVIAVMSGNFVQRGDFAVYSKWERAKVALENGIDLVIELPSPIATMSAEGFCDNAVKLINDIGCVDSIAFGAECSDICELWDMAKLLLSDKTQMKITAKMNDEKISYPQARQKIIDNKLISTPNNILATEYLKSIIKNNFDLNAIAVKRIGSGHDQLGDNLIPSASQIRKQLNENSFNEICSIYRCERSILSKLRTMNANDYKQIPDVKEGLENKIEDSIKKAASLEELYFLIKSKRYTLSRIRRIILKSYLGITNDYNKSSPYIRILGFNKKGQEILKTMKKTAKIPIILNYSQVKKLDNECQNLFNNECMWTDMYNLGFKEIKACGEDMTANIIRMI